jgi:hypothetical protein
MNSPSVDLSQGVLTRLQVLPDWRSHHPRQNEIRRSQGEVS